MRSIRLTLLPSFAILGAAGSGEEETGQAMPNLLPNPGFSEVAAGRPAGWTGLHAGGARSGEAKLAASPDGRDDSLCLSISSSLPAGSGAAATVPVKRHTRYRLSGWIKTIELRPGGDGSGALLDIRGGERTGSVKGTAGWTEVSVEFDSGERSELLVRCLFGCDGGATGTALYDDVSLTEIPGDGAAEEAVRAPAATAGLAKPAERKFEPDPAVHGRGKAVYDLACITCHGPDGKGIPGAFPPLDASEWVTGDIGVPVRIVLHGLAGPVNVAGEDYHNVMPGHPDLDDLKISDVLTYVRQSWSNDAAPVTPAGVKAIREKFSGRTHPWTASELGR